MKKEDFTKLFGMWREETLHLLPPFEGMILGKKVRVLRKNAL